MKSKAKQFIGIDISDASIEVAEMMRLSGELQIAKLERTRLEAGLVKHGRILDAHKLKEKLEELIRRIGGVKDKELVFVLPESQVYIKVLYLELGSSANVQVEIRSELEKCIPIKKDKLIIEHRKLGQTKVGEERLDCVLTASVDSEVIAEWEGFFADLGLEIEVFDPESLATYRWIHYKETQKNLLLLDLGAATSNISIFTDLGLVYNHTYFFAGLNITKKIADELNIDLAEAESKKKEIGLEGTGAEADISTLIKKCFDQIVGVVKENVDDFREKHTKQKEFILDTAVLLGGTAQTKGISGYMKEQMPEFDFLATDVYFQDKNVSLYQGAIGAALRGMDRRWSRNDPVFYPSHKNENDRSHDSVIPSLVKNISTTGVKDFMALNSKKLIAGLVILFVLGILAVLSNTIFGSGNKQDHGQAQISAVANIIYFELPLVLDGSSDGEDSSWGRMLEVPRTAGDEEEIALENEARAQLNESELLWDEPVNIGQNQPGSPAVFLAYNEMLLNSYITKVAGTILGRDDVAVDDIVIKQMEEGRSRVYIARGRVNMMLGDGESIEKIAPVDINRLKRDRLKIKEIGSQLNVRQGPGTNFAVIDKVDPGDVYPIVESDATWTKIELTGGREGWIYANYTEIVK